ncbi:hypothetical protein C0Q70_14312 [Pomacea canaliculata]|uniref:GH10 domain-containing protein n=1 Tax=Pomacea canaliculata TaxID=400727 RepID=A0A2T7NZN4_POMCA|nr:hypothetical protein C0Q70_14312 [Pomacea canaliculata]
MDVTSRDENKRADYYEKALRAMYGHQAVEGILLNSFWDSKSPSEATNGLVVGDNPGATGRRVLDLLEKEWMTDETRTLSESGQQFTVRGFHGDYESSELEAPSRSLKQSHVCACDDNIFSSFIHIILLDGDDDTNCRRTVSFMARVDHVVSWSEYTTKWKLRVFDRMGMLESREMQSDQHWTQWSALNTRYWQAGSMAGADTVYPRDPGRSYRVSGYIRLHNDDNKGQSVQVSLDYTFPDDSHTYQAAAVRSSLRVANGWASVSGNFRVPDREIKSVRIYFEGPSPDVSFEVDDASVEEVGASGSWRNVTQHVIETVRKSDIHFNVTLASNVNAGDVQIHVLQTRKSFPFGTGTSTLYLDPTKKAYSDFLNRHFNWVWPGNELKWYATEPQQGSKNYEPALNMIRELQKHGIQMRGHCLLWSDGNYVQSWVKALSKDDLLAAVYHHVYETLNITKGLIHMWDVNNEILHGHWYQDTLRDPDFNIKLYRDVHNYDPSLRLFFNEYNVVGWGDTTDAYLEQALKFKAADVGLSALGAQGRFPQEQEPDPDVIKQRLDTLAKSGLPIWITEMDVIARDENKRADYFEKALRAMYGHPAVEGILIDNFWDSKSPSEASHGLVAGDNLEMTAAGRRVLDLLEKEWMTDETRTLSESGQQFTVRGFHGDYEVHVVYKGHDLQQLKKTFTLGKTATNVAVHVSV